MEDEFVSIEDIMAGKYTGESVKVRGWIYRTRGTKKLRFIVLRNSTGIIQVTIIKGELPDEEFEAAERALVESSLWVEGVVREDKRAPGGYEIQARKVNIIHFAEIFPITKDKSDEFLMDVRHLWLRSRQMTSTLKIRSTVFKLFREFFLERGFYETHSPTFVTGACEGGSTLFPVKYFDREVYLTQSWQLYAEAMIYSLEKIFTVAPSFRAEKSRTRRHLTEFWHGEVEAAWMGNEDMMKLEEEMMEYILEGVIKERRADLEYLGRDISFLKEISPPFERLPYRKVLEMLNEKGFNLEWGDDFGYDEEKALTEEFSQPFFITHFPRSKGFYHRPDPENPEVLLCHDMLAPEGYGEIIGGGERIWEKEVLLERIKEFGLDPENYSWYVDLRRYGSVPHSGFGLGLDRFITWIADIKHIKYAIPFPRTPRRVTP
ncbi:MAG: asparagine--tRNA ligase [Thermoplasmata archaeon]|nr:asparagine--tRNA ligase [Thermoplasmata archaeon]